MKAEEQITAPRLWMVLAKAHRSIVGYIEGRLAEQGLGLSDFAVLEVLLHKGPQTISAIGEKVLLASASMTSAIDRLEKRGLVARKTCDKDRRVRYVDLTASGRELIGTIYAAHERDLDFLVEGLSGDERQGLYDGLKKIGFAAKGAWKEKYADDSQEQ